MGAVPQDHDIPQPLRLFKGVQVGPLQVFQQPQRRRAVIRIIAENGGNGAHLGQLTGPETPLPRDQFVAVFRLPYRDRLQQAVFPDALGEARQLRFVKAGPRLIGRGMDVVHREKKDLPG